METDYENYFDENPIFKIEEVDTGKKYQVYLDGRVEGFGCKIYVRNSIPAAIDHAIVNAEKMLLTKTVQGVSNLIVQNGWDLDFFHLDVGSNSDNEGASQDEKLCAVITTLHSPSLSGDSKLFSGW